MTRMPTDTLASRLLRIRKDAGVSQAECAEVIGVTERAYRNYELGERELPLNAAKAIIKEFSIDPMWLLFGDNTSAKGAE